MAIWVVKFPRKQIHSTSNEGIWQQIFSNFMHGVESAKLALLTPCMEFENASGQIPFFEVL